ncbi:MAG TPA: D-alanine--D-alanine ligase [Planctomycetota bacterium]|nr:D-alanine--D-alanine ligase [Planctomycetota bacterium]
MPKSNHDVLAGLSIGVLYGGPSSEREVSIQSGENAAKALSAAGREVHRVLLDGTFSVRDARSLGIDVALLALHGEFGEDGRIQNILEEADIPYTGSGVDASSRAFDKVLAKQSFERHSVRTPAWMSIDVPQKSVDPTSEKLGDLNPPVVIKPATGGSSLGVSIVRRQDQVASAIKKASEFGDCILIERCISGREVTVAVLGEDALPVAELKLPGEFYDYNAKYVDERTRIICPAEMDEQTASRVRALGLAAHRALGCRDVSRTDIMLDENNVPWVLEVNTLPGMTSHSLLPRAAAAVGINFTDLCEGLLRLTLERAMRRAVELEPA